MTAQPPSRSGSSSRGDGARHALAAAAFITADRDDDFAVRFSTEVVLDQPAAAIARATLTATAKGVYEAFINGIPVTASVLNPGWTAYEWRLAVQTFDVTDLLASSGPSPMLQLELGNGWYRGKLGFESADVVYGDEVSVAAALTVDFHNGRSQTITTTTAWIATASQTTRNSLYNGQTIDARLRWANHVLPVREVTVDRAVLQHQAAPPILRHETLWPVDTWTSPSGKTLIDFGQNIVGWVRFSLKGARGTTIRMRHAEVLENGELSTRPLRHAAATDEFVLSGEVDQFEPTFTFHGFRYVEVEGWPAESDLREIEAVVVHSQMKRTGFFACSEPLVNQLVQNAVWSQRGNFLSIPTDCPQRDERLGWTGDVSVFAASAMFQFDAGDFLDSWLADLALETENSQGGLVPLVVPDVLKYARFPDFELPWQRATAVWGDAAVWVPEALWHALGDRERLAAHYPVMVRHLESVQQDVSPSGLWDLGVQLGDWLDPDAPIEDPGAGKADPSVIATACLYRSAAFAADAAEELGYTGDAKHWKQVAQRTKAAFTDAYVSSAGVILSDCAAVYALALRFGLLEEPQRSRAGDRLAELVRKADYQVTTGFAGTPFVTWALSETGHIAEAYRLLLRQENPSWLYPVTMGATTIWERWDSMLPDGSVNEGELTSFNHFALGAVVDWIYKVIGGIRPVEPGYRSVHIQPQPGPGITWADTRFDSPTGVIHTKWEVHAQRFTLHLELPATTPADVVLPDGTSKRVVGGSHDFVCDLAR